MIKVKEALNIINKTVTEIGSEKISIKSSIGRVTAENIIAKIDNPPFDMSSMDGYAIKYSKLLDKKTKFLIKDEIFAGEKKTISLKKFETARIFTGGRIPKNSDTVVIQENSNFLDKNHVSFNAGLYKNKYIRKKGRDFKEGHILLKAAHIINEKDLGLLISSNNNFIKVKRKPRVAIFSTGDEIIEQGKKLKPGQIFASSIYILKEMIESTGCICKNIKLLKDNKEVLKKTFMMTKNVDLIITTGGISEGKKDLVKSCLLELGLKLKFWKVKIKPGKPILFGTLNNIPIFSLPGNPVSTYVCFLIFVLSAITKMNNTLPNYIEVQANLQNEIKNTSERESYLRGVYNIKKNYFNVHVLNDQDSSMMKNLALSNCLIRIKANDKRKSKGSMVNILIFNTFN